MKTKDMTQGNVLKVLLLFALPMLLSVSFQQFYNIADSVIAGRFIGKNALAAVSASYPITMIYLAIGTGSGVGCSIIVSQIFGSKDKERLKSSITTSLLGILGFGLFALGLGLLINNWVMEALNTPSEVFSDAATYLKIFVYGLPFLFLYNACNSIFQAMGNSKTPLYFLIASTFINIILNLVFVIKFDMGVAGLAWGTFIAQGVASMLSLFVLLKDLQKIKSKKYQLFSLTLMMYMLTYAIPSIIQSSIVSIGQLFVQNLVNSYGPDVMAGFGSAIKINTFIISLITTLSIALSNFTGQNIGAKQYERIAKGFRAGLLLIFVVLIGPFIFTFFFPERLIRLFLEQSLDSNAVIEIGKQFLLIVSPFYFVIAFKITADGILRGAGDLTSFMIATLIDLIIRVSFSYLLSSILSSHIGIFWSFPIGWVVGTIFSFIFYYSGRWKKQIIKGNGLAVETA